jgi:hypothetical protein
MTCEMRSGEHQTRFSEWTRTVPRLDSSIGFSMLDADRINPMKNDEKDRVSWFWHRYLAKGEKINNRILNHLMLIEEKSHGKDITFSQSDTMTIINQCMKKCDKDNFRVKAARGNRVALCWWGYNKLQYSGASPQDSKWIKWNDQEISLETLIGILEFDINPHTFEPINHKFESDRRVEPID